MATDEERIARVMTQAEGVHPEHPCQGLGELIPKGETWPAWKVRLPQALAAISEMKAIEREKADTPKLTEAQKRVIDDLV